MDSYEIPILLAFYTREENVERLVDRLRVLRPTKIYVSSDGPRSKADERRILLCREAISRIDWGAQVVYFYHEKNLGMYDAFAVALDYILSRESGVIILEDDCIPNQDFFDYVKEMSNKYENERSIAAYCGYNAIGSTPHLDRGLLTHTLSKRYRYWGHYIKAEFWNEFRSVDFSSPLSRYFCIREGIRVPGVLSKAILVRTLLKQRLEIGPGDILLDVFLKSSKRFVTIPSKSLIRNIGDGVDAAHTKSIPDVKLRNGKKLAKWPSKLDGLYTARIEIIEGYLLVVWKFREMTGSLRKAPPKFTPKS